MERLDLKRIRKEHKLTQQQLAKKLSYPQGFLSLVENGKKRAPENLVELIKKELKIEDIESYFYLSDDDPVKSREEILIENKIREESKAKEISLQSTISRLIGLLENKEEKLDVLEDILQRLEILEQKVSETHSLLKKTKRV